MGYSFSTISRTLITLFAELKRVLRFGRYCCSLLRCDLRLTEDCGQPEWRAIGTQLAVAER